MCCSPRETTVSVTGTDLEVELVATSDARSAAGRHHGSGRKLLDIFRAFPRKRGNDRD
jgi:hypothetical protein